MTKDEILAKTKEVAGNYCSTAPEDIAVEANFTEDLGVDSLDMVEIIMELEEVFEVELEDGEADELQTVDDVVNYIAKKLEG